MVDSTVFEAKLTATPPPSFGHPKQIESIFIKQA